MNDKEEEIKESDSESEEDLVTRTLKHKINPMSFLLLGKRANENKSEVNKR
jgi:hypothetical protein